MAPNEPSSAALRATGRRGGTVSRIPGPHSEPVLEAVPVRPASKEPGTPAAAGPNTHAGKSQHDHPRGGHEGVEPWSTPRVVDHKSNTSRLHMYHLKAFSLYIYQNVVLLRDP